MSKYPKIKQFISEITGKAGVMLLAFSVVLTVFSACSPVPEKSGEPLSVDETKEPATEKHETERSGASLENGEPDESETLLPDAETESPAVESGEPVPDDDPDSVWWEGVYLKTESEPMIYIRNCGPCYMYGLTEELLAVLEPLHTGDVIEA